MKTELNHSEIPIVNSLGWSVMNLIHSVQFTWLHCWHLLQGNKSDPYLHYDGFSKELTLCGVDLWSGNMILTVPLGRSRLEQYLYSLATCKIWRLHWVLIKDMNKSGSSYAVYTLVVKLHAMSIHYSHQEFSLTLADASKATFTASPSSCFLANRNKAAPLPSDTSVKNECLGEQTYVSLSASQPSSVASGLNPFTPGDNETMQLTGMDQFF